MKRRRQFTILRLLAMISFFAVICALWFTPVKFTFELRGKEVRTSARIGDLIDVRRRHDRKTLLSKAKIIEYVRRGRVSEGTDVDVVTIKTTLIDRIRLSFYDDFAARYYDQ